MEEIIKVSTILELNSVIFNYWVGLIEKGDPLSLFTNDRGAIADLANMIYLSRLKENDYKMFDDENMYKEAKERSLKFVEKKLLCDSIYMHNCSIGGKGCYFEETFGPCIHSKKFIYGSKWGGDHYMAYFTSREKYKNNPISQERIDPEKLDDILSWHPGGPTLCTRTSGGVWKIIANAINVY